eukprot:g4484.t1
MLDSSLWMLESEFESHLGKSTVEESDKQKAREEVEERHTDSKNRKFVKFNAGDWIFGTNPFSQPPWNCPIDCSTRCGDQDPHNSDEEASKRGEVGHDLVPYHCCAKDLGIENALEELGHMIGTALDNLDDKLEEAKETLKQAAKPLMSVPRILHDMIKSLLEWIVNQYKDTEIYKAVTEFLSRMAGRLSFNINALIKKGREMFKNNDLLSWTIASTGSAIDTIVTKITEFFQAIEEMYHQIVKRVNTFVETLPWVTDKKVYSLVGGEAPTVDVNDAPLQGYWSGNVSPYCRGISLGVKLTDGKLVGCVQEHAHEVCLEEEKEEGHCPSKSAYLEQELETGVSVPLEPIGFLRLRTRLVSDSGLMGSLLLRVPATPLTGEKIDVSFFEFPIGSTSGDARFRSTRGGGIETSRGLLRHNKA